MVTLQRKVNKIFPIIRKQMMTFKFDTWPCIQKFPDCPPGARTANGTALCH